MKNIEKGNEKQLQKALKYTTCCEKYGVSLSQRRKVTDSISFSDEVLSSFSAFLVR